MGSISVLRDKLLLLTTRCTCRRKSSRRLRNEVKGIEVGSQWSEEPDVVCREAKKLFEDRYQVTHDYRVRLGTVEFKTLSLEASSGMIANFTEEEIKEAVWQCEG